MARLHALRGATTVDRNDADAIVGGTEWLMREIMKRNDLSPEAVVSCIFTLTADPDAEFPAVAARRLGFDGVPLLCAREIPVPGSLPRVIRVLMHYYAEDDDHEAKHVYLGEARSLRTDLESPQGSSSPNAFGAFPSIRRPAATSCPRTSRCSPPTRRRTR